MIGVDPTTIPTLSPDPAPPTQRYTDSVPDKEARLFAAAPDWREDYYVLRRAFSFDELARVWMGSVITSDVSRWFEEEHPLLEKVRHSLWHHRACDATYDHLVSGIAGLRRLTWPDAEVHLAYCSKYRADGSAENLTAVASRFAEAMCQLRRAGPIRGEAVLDVAEQAGVPTSLVCVSDVVDQEQASRLVDAVWRAMQLWIDNDLAALVHVGGRHVLTVGFGLGASACYVSQVQLREPRGNRWLYRVPGHYLDVALDMLAAAFHGYDLWLVDGGSAAAAVRRSYGKGPCTMTAETEARIVALYDRQLAAFDRTATTDVIDRRTYRKLQSTSRSSVATAA
jgi:hypothetical protein